MKLIVLNERQDSGKSSTIREIRNLLLKNKGKLIWESPKNLPKYIEPIKKRNDIISIINYKNKNIGLCSKGDTPGDIQKIFYNLFYHASKYKLKLDVLVCASRNHDNNACNNFMAVMDYINYHLTNKETVIENGKKLKIDDILIYSLMHFEIYKKGKKKFDVFKDGKKIFSNI